MRIVRHVGMLLGGCLALVLAACAGSPPPAEAGTAARGGEAVLETDAMVRAVAEEVVRELAGGPERTLVVSYFTEEGEISAISESLIGDLTTTLATVGKGTLKVVSRQVLDRLLEEISFQAGDLAGEEGRIRVGRQLGADLILTGFLTSPEGDGSYRLNTQLVEVETGVVVTGLILDFQPRGDLARKLDDGSSRTEIARRGVVEVSGVGTVTTVFEDFDHGPPEITLDRYEDYWGDRVESTGGTVEVVQKGSIDGSAFVRYTHTARVDTMDLPAAWRESGLRFVSRIAPGVPVEGYDGVSFALKAEGFGVAALFLKQSVADREMWFYLSLPVSAGEWREYKIPFDVFEPSDPGDSLDPGLPVVMDISVALDENWYGYWFRSGTDLHADLSVDNVGYYRQKSEDDTRVVETFDDEIQRLPWYAYLYGVSVYRDYTASDEGVDKMNPGVSGESLRYTTVEPDAAGAGRAFALEGSLTLTGGIRSFFDEGQGLTLFMSSPLRSDPTGFSALSFYIRSDLLTNGRLEIWDQEHERAYSYEIRASGFWTRVRVPFAALVGDQGSLRDALSQGIPPGRARILLSFDLPRGPLEAVGAGVRPFVVGLDDFLWE